MVASVQRYEGMRRKDLTYHGDKLSVSDDQVRRDVILYSGVHGYDQEGVGFIGFGNLLDQRAFPRADGAGYQVHIHEISMRRLVPTITRVTISLLNCLS